jgi:hypothetical protein
MQLSGIGYQGEKGYFFRGFHAEIPYKTAVPSQAASIIIVGESANRIKHPCY